MKAVLRSVPIVAVLCLLAWPAQAADGVLIVETIAGGGPTQTQRVQIEGNRMRVDSSGGAAGQQAFIFDGTKQVMWIVDFGHKSYREVTKADLDRLGGQMSAAMAQMQEQLKNMPPEQRQRMEEMMKNMPGGGGAVQVPKTEYRKTGTGTVGRWTCQKYDGYRNGQKVAEMCTVSPAALGFTAADFDVSRSLAEFFQKLMPKNADRMFSIGDPALGFEGVPVRRIDYTSSGQIVVQVTEVGRHSFPDAIFEVPAGFTKTASPFGPRK